MMELDLRRLDLGAERLGTAVGLHLLQVGVLGVHGLAQRVLQEPAALMQANRVVDVVGQVLRALRSEEHMSELQSHSFISYAVFCLKKKQKQITMFPERAGQCTTAPEWCQRAT